MTSKTKTGLGAGPRLKLLHELEPAHRVFWRNLTDLMMSRAPVPVATTTQPGKFWSDVFVSSSIPWWWFLESLLCHLIAIAIVMNATQEWVLREQMAQRQKISRRESITYYPPLPSFPAIGSNPGRVAGGTKRKAGPGRPSRIWVAPEQAQKIVAPPDLKLNGSAQPNLMAFKPALPPVPLAATVRSRRPGSVGGSLVVGPPPELRPGAGTGRRASLLQVSAVGPTASLGGLSSLRTSATPSATVVGPPPTMRDTVHRISDFDIGRTQAVAPAPHLVVEEQRSLSGAGRGIPGGVPSAVVVPPPPSLQRLGLVPGQGRNGPSSGGVQVAPPAPTIQEAGGPVRGRLGSFSTASVQVVPPAPSVQGGRVTGGGMTVLSSSGVQVVPPAPSLAGAGRLGGGELSTMATGAVQAVPPAPSLPGAGSATGRGRGSEFSNAGVQAVPPAPALQGTTGGGGGREMASLAGGGLAASPPASVQNAVSSAAGGRAMDVTQSSAAESDDSHEPATEDLPIRIIGQALALPNSSYFSNYEVFIAERRRGKGTQLIKLVYVSLPYQRRLSEYGVNSAKIYKLRVTRDASCDETLLEMTWPQADASHPNSGLPIGPPTLGPNDRNSTLPCYRTTADDYRKALSK